MKKLKNSYKLIIAFILGVLFSTITTVQAYKLYAEDINFTPTNINFKKQDGTNITNVKEAIDTLYDKTDYKDLFKEPIFKEILTNAQTNVRQNTITLNKGEYLILRINGCAWENSKSENIQNVNIYNEDNENKLISNSNKTEIKYIYGRSYDNTGGGRDELFMEIQMYYIRIKDEQDTLSYNYKTSTTSNVPLTQAYNVIPLK